MAIVYATVPSYWLLIHPRARRWAERGGRRLMAVGPVWMLLWMAAAAITWKWRQVSRYDIPWMWLPGGALIACGFVIYIFGRRGFSTDQVLGRAELEPHKHEQHLVVSGIRARVRHPYYLGHLLELTGWALGSGLAVVWGLLGFAVVTGYFMVRAEERELEARFGDEYRQYRGRSAAMIPGIW